MHIAEFQNLMGRTYLERDRRRGTDATFRWLAEEVGELARSLRHHDPKEHAHEFADVLAWLASLANLLGVNLDDAVDRYRKGCPKCGEVPCTCPF